MLQKPTSPLRKINNGRFSLKAIGWDILSQNIWNVNQKYSDKIYGLDLFK